VDGLIASRIDRLVLAASGPAIVVAGGRFTFQFQANGVLRKINGVRCKFVRLL